MSGLLPTPPRDARKSGIRGAADPGARRDSLQSLRSRRSSADTLESDERLDVFPDASLPMSRKSPTAADDVDGIEDLRAENTELHSRVRFLESKLQEYEEMVGEGMLQSTDMVFRSESMKPAGAIVAKMTAERNRLLWQSTIAAVRLRNSWLKKQVLMMKLSAAEVKIKQARAKAAELQIELKRARQEKEALVQEKHMDLTELEAVFAMEKKHLEDSYQGQIVELQSTHHLGMKIDWSTSSEGPTISPAITMKSSPSIMDEVRSAGRRKLSMGRLLFDEADDGSDSRSSAAPSVVAAWRPAETTLRLASDMIEVQREEIEQWQTYAQSLEERLCGAMAAQDELIELRHRVHNLQEAAAGKWWCGERNVLCGGRRPSMPRQQQLALDGATGGTVS